MTVQPRCTDCVFNVAADTPGRQYPISRRSLSKGLREHFHEVRIGLDCLNNEPAEKISSRTASNDHACRCQPRSVSGTCMWFDGAQFAYIVMFIYENVVGIFRT